MAKLDSPIENPELSAGYLVRDTFLAYSKLMRVWLQPYKITPGQYFFLRALWIEEGLSQRELSRRVGTTEPTTVAALRLLERNGLVRRVRNADDRRTINIFLTDRARALKPALLGHATDANAIAARGIPEEEIERLRATLRRMRANVADALGSEKN